MSGSSVKKYRRTIRKVAGDVARDQHLETIRNYIDGIIGLSWNKRLKVCFAIFCKKNPFGKGDK